MDFGNINEAASGLLTLGGTSTGGMLNQNVTLNIHNSTLCLMSLGDGGHGYGITVQGSGGVATGRLDPQHLQPGQ